MGGLGAFAYMGGCLVARPKSGPPPASPIRATRELPRVTVVLTGVAVIAPPLASGAGRPRESLIPDSTKAASVGGA